MTIKQPAIALLCLFCAAACDPIVDNRGYVAGADFKSNVIPGQTTQNELLEHFGSPSSKSSFGPEAWYYITQRKETEGFFAPEVAKQDVVRIEFDQNNVVSKLEHFDEANSREFDLAKRKTPTEGHSLGFVEQVLGNIGRFNKSGSSPSPGRRSIPGGY